MSSPSNSTFPPAILALYGNSRIIVRAREVFPQPDSPTSPMASLFSISRVMPSTAFTSPLRVE